MTKSGEMQEEEKSCGSRERQGCTGFVHCRDTYSGAGLTHRQTWNKERNKKLMFKGGCWLLPWKVRLHLIHMHGGCYGDLGCLCLSSCVWEGVNRLSLEQRITRHWGPGGVGKTLEHRNGWTENLAHRNSQMSLEVPWFFQMHFVKMLETLGDGRKRRWGKEFNCVFLQGK